MKPGSILKWQIGRRTGRFRAFRALRSRSARYIVINQHKTCWLLYDIQKECLFWHDQTWINLNLMEVT